MHQQTDWTKAHLLRRFGLGASLAELDAFKFDTYSQVLENLIAATDAPDEPEAGLDRFGNEQGLVQIRSVQLRWHARMITSRRPLLHAATLFWHDHFATSAMKVDKPTMMHLHLETIEKHALGPFPELLRAMSRDPGMLYWLDNHENRKGTPNENFARELLELFTLGIGHYSEQDVLEAARAFTGWSFVSRGGGRNANQANAHRFVLNRAMHDDGEKTVLGHVGRLDGDGVLDILVQHPQTARFVVRKAWEWFAYPAPSEALVERLAKAWREAGMDGKALVRLIAGAPEFVSDRARRAIVKNPVHFCVSTARQLGFGAVVAARLAEPDLARRVRTPAAASMQAAKAMGMEVLYPPDVAGWETGEGWISSATMLERIKWASRIFGAGAESTAAPAVYGLFAADPTPSGVVRRLAEVFDAEVPEGRRALLEEAARKAAGAAVRPQNARAVAVSVAKLLFGLPEFQMA